MSAAEVPKDANNIQLLRDFVTSRYDKERRYLNLEVGILLGFSVYGLH